MMHSMHSSSDVSFRLHASTLSLAGLLITLGVHSSSAQPSRPDCQHLLRAATTAPKEALSSRYLQNCGPDGVAALANLVRRAATQSDTAYLFELRLAATDVALRPILDAAVDLVSNRSATLASRTEGLLIVVEQVYGQDAFITGLVEPVDECRLLAGSRTPTEGEISLLRQLAKRLSDDRTEPSLLRQGGLCITQYYRPGYVLAEDVRQIHVMLKCESYYHIANDLDHQIIVGYRARSAKTTQGIVIPAHKEIVIYLPFREPVRFFSADELIAQVPSSTKRCGEKP